MIRGGKGPGKYFHVVVGPPSDDCPICRAHGKAPGDQVLPGGLGPMLIQPLPIDRILRCPCPLCTKARPKVVEE